MHGTCEDCHGRGFCLSLNGHLVEDLCLFGGYNRVMVIVEDGWFYLVPHLVITIMMMMMIFCQHFITMLKFVHGCQLCNRVGYRVDIY